MTPGDPQDIRRPPVEAVERCTEGVVVRLAGELDLYNVPEVKAALDQLAAESPNRVVVDLGAVDFLDSTALGALVEARRRLTPAPLLLSAPGPHVRRALDVSGLAKHFAVYETAADALAASP